MYPKSFSKSTLPFWRMPGKGSPGNSVALTERTIGDHRRRVLIATPTGTAARRPAVLWMHAGGMIFGNPESSLPIAGLVAREVGAVVVLPSYRLAPEHPFPAALDDCMAVLLWVRANAAELGIDPGRIAVGGSSAGAGLGAAVAQRSTDEGIALRAQTLVYPMLDDRTVLRDDHGRRGRLMWTPQSNRFAWTSYLGRAPELSDAPEYAAPARRNDLTGLPPAWIGVGDLDLFHDEDEAYAERLRDSGVDCEFVSVPGMYHAADRIAGDAPSMVKFRTSMLDHLRAHLASEE
jgi:acetyl esterase/lipase